MSQTLGLALLAGFPLYACGSVLGTLGAAASTDRDGLEQPPGAAASLGAALGFVLTGALLPRAPLPSSLLVAGVVMLSLGGMVYGIVLGSRMQVDVRARRRSMGAEVRIEDRRLPPEDLLSRVLLEGEHERRRLMLEGKSEVPWDVAVARATMVEETEPWRVLLVGGGASALPRSVLREHPTARVDVVERGSGVVELGREYMETELAVGVLGRANVLIGNLDDRVGELSGPYDLAIVDTTALAGMGGVTGLAPQTRTALLRLVGSEGVLVWGPAQPEAGVPELVDGRPRLIFRRGTGSAAESLLVALPAGEAAWPERFDGFVAAGGGTDVT